LLDHKFRLLAGHAVDNPDALAGRFTDLAAKSPQKIGVLYDFEIRGQVP
jgi:hypothetical protein